MIYGNAAPFSKIKGISAVILLCFSAQAIGQGTSDPREPARGIYQSLFRYALTQPLQPGSADPPSSFCVVPQLQVLDVDRQRVDLLRDTGDRSLYPMVSRYDRLAVRRLRGAVRQVGGVGELTPASVGGRAVPLSECDALKLLQLQPPLVIGNVAFLGVSINQGCNSSTYNFAFVQRHGAWEVEGFRWNLVAGEYCLPTPRSRRSGIDADREVLLVGGSVP